MPSYRYPTQIAEEAKLVLEQYEGHKVDPKACRQACHAVIGFCYAQEDKVTGYHADLSTEGMQHDDLVATLKMLASEPSGSPLHAWDFPFADLVVCLQGIIAYLENLIRPPPPPKQPTSKKPAPIHPQHPKKEHSKKSHEVDG